MAVESPLEAAWTLGRDGVASFVAMWGGWMEVSPGVGRNWPVRRSTSACTCLSPSAMAGGRQEGGRNGMKGDPGKRERERDRGNGLIMIIAVEARGCTGKWRKS